RPPNDATDPPKPPRDAPDETPDDVPDRVPDEVFDDTLEPPDEPKIVRPCPQLLPDRQDDDWLVGSPRCGPHCCDGIREAATPPALPTAITTRTTCADRFIADQYVIEAALRAPPANDAMPSQIADAVSPLAIRRDRSGTGMRTT